MIYGRRHLSGKTGPAGCLHQGRQGMHRRDPARKKALSSPMKVIPASNDPQSFLWWWSAGKAVRISMPMAGHRT